MDRVDKEDNKKKDDSKTPSEYALHILFTQVSTNDGNEGRRSEWTQWARFEDKVRKSQKSRDQKKLEAFPIISEHF